ncbi:hypothetical protein AOLI_G00049390 [Acnodon oligacanthus]
MQMADPEVIQKALSEQGELLGRHQHVLIGVTHSLKSLTHQQAKQQAQLVQLVDGIKGLMGQIQTLSFTDSATNTVPSITTEDPTMSTFPV